jgi:hypothetical protein
METMSNSQHQSQQQNQHPMIEELLVLLQQETASCYQPADYLAYLTTTATAAATATATAPVSAVAEMEIMETGPDGIDEVSISIISSVQRRHEYVTMRQKMGEWAYDGKYYTTVFVDRILIMVSLLYTHTTSLVYCTVIDYHGMSREVGALAMNYTDRYMRAHRDQRPHHHDLEEEELPTGRSYQLIVMTGLYLAIKLSIGSYFGELLDARTMCAMSRGMFTRDKLLAMERNVLHTLAWRMHPPTAKVFLNHYLELLASHCCRNVDKKQWHAVRNEADFMLEHAVLDYHFCGHYPSVIAVAALCNTTSVVWNGGNNYHNNPLSLLKQILAGQGCSWDQGQVADCRQRLHDLMVHYHTHHQAAAGQRPEQTFETADQLRIQSPVSVVEVVDLTKMAKKQKTEASMLTIDITSANATDATATQDPS